jgi:hypothetical protein
MSTPQTASEQIAEEATSWLGVTAATGIRGEFAFRVGGREIGQLHGEHAAHLAFPKNVGARLREQGRIVDHPIFSRQSGPGRAQNHEPGRHRQRDRAAPAQLRPPRR